MECGATRWLALSARTGGDYRDQPERGYRHSVTARDAGGGRPRKRRVQGSACCSRQRLSWLRASLVGESGTRRQREVHSVEGVAAGKRQDHCLFGGGRGGSRRSVA